jgi:uncharacterized RDD family membrane protein YckC
MTTLPDPGVELPAGVAVRLAAMFYEAALLFGVLFGVGYVVLAGLHWEYPLAPARQAVLQVAWFGAMGAYFVYCWSTGGQTLAMKTWHLRLVDAQGRRPSASRATARYCLAWLLLAGPALLGLAIFRTHTPLDLAWLPLPLIGAAVTARLSPQRQWPHDQLLRTRVIRDAQVRRR